MEGFIELFSNRDDETYEHILRQKFKISKTEERFRLDHSPENKQKTHEYKKLKTSLLKKIE
jgi:hypothetical protein